MLRQEGDRQQEVRHQGIHRRGDMVVGVCRITEEIVKGGWKNGVRQQLLLEISEKLLGITPTTVSLIFFFFSEKISLTLDLPEGVDSTPTT